MNESTLKVIIASKNPVKIGAASKGFQSSFSAISFHFEGIATESGVPDQPKGNNETLLGAKNRAENARELNPEADYSVGIEGGIAFTDTGTEAFAWVYIIDKAGRVGLGKTGSFYLPNAITKLLQDGMELGAADDIVFDRSNSKQDNGAVGILTQNQIDRESYYKDAVTLALIPFLNHELYFDKTTSTPKP